MCTKRRPVQSVVRNGYVVLAALCTEACKLRAEGVSMNAVLPKPLRRAIPRVAAGHRMRLRIPVRGSALQVLRRGSAVLRVAVTATDVAGNATTRVRHVAAIVHER